MICDNFRLSNYALARSGGGQNWRPVNRQLRIHFSARMIKLVQSTSTRRWSRLSFEQRTAHMQHRYLVILLMALESYGVELSSYFRRASNRRIHSRTTRWIELYNMQSKSKGLHLFTHMIKLVQSTMVPLKFRTKDCNMHWKVSKDQHALKSLKVVTELNWTKRITCSTVLNLETGRRPVQRRKCTSMPLGSSKMAKKNSGSSIFSLKHSSNKIFIALAIIRISSNERQRNCW